MEAASITGAPKSGTGAASGGRAGAHAGCIAFFAKTAASIGKVPVAGITRKSRPTENAICAPSGDQAGNGLSAYWIVKRLASPPETEAESSA
jgi:hypothetical protein